MAKSKFSLVGKITLSSIIIYCLALSALESLVVVYHHAFVVKFILTPQGKGISDSDLIYHGIFFLSLIYQVAFCVYSLITRNSIQLMALVVFNILSLAYAGVQIYQHIILEEEGTIGAEFKPDDKFKTPEDARDFFVKRMRPIEYIIASLVLTFSIYLSFLSYKLTKEFGWENYKTYTADLKVRKAYVSLTILQTLVKLDIFFLITYAIQLVPSKLIGYSRSIFETVLVFVIGFLLSSLAWYSVDKEMKYILLIVINLCCISLAYIVYRLIGINSPVPDDTIDPYQFTRRLLTFTLSVTFVLVCATIYYGIICFRNMTRGIYIYTVYGLPGSKNDNNISPDEIRKSKRASKKAELVRTSTAISLD
ncbi:unnamed protein product [Rhizophagus irregularis]|uniref:Uncharacterized protein n=1 Tax=Rhizophagus irregularis TaxID=588596 RepID=A0A2I1GG54_9GLOM|nr:hypothetical protein RhiirA4_319287 [Rhizophagus irregularis]CAB4403810.1 unnamed protein product [Rhizophagus irregularis]CAB4404817.1 unnamed protein product [Rhizophagus irregularis]